MHPSDKKVPLVDVAAGIIWQANKFLVALRPEGKPRGGFWEFPGGKREPGETMQEALRRELHEELGIISHIIIPWQETFHAYPDLHVQLHFMHVTAFSGSPVAQEGQTLRWVTAEEASELHFLPADKEILPHISPPNV